jgi:adenine-specific DNA-methyltransferase
LPTLNWIGKEPSSGITKDVPFRLLESVPELACGASDSGNLMLVPSLISGLWAALSEGRCCFVMVQEKCWDAIDALLS